MGIISYAQNFEDVLLNRVFAGLNYGFYVDIGAYHPVDDSVTKTFYDRGWSGLNIEPGEIFSELAAARPRDTNLNMAVYDRSGEITFVQHPGWYAGLSHVNATPTVESSPAPAGDPDVVKRQIHCDTLMAIIEAHASRQPIAFMKIDAEGAETAIVTSTDWRAIRPTVLVIEATLPRSNVLDNAAWEPHLLAHGYVRAYFDGLNCFYVPEERRDLLPHFALPVNTLDGFVRYDPTLAECRAQLQILQTRLDAVSAERAVLAADTAQLKAQHDSDTTLLHAFGRSVEELRAHYETQLQAAQAAHDARRHEQDSALRAAQSAHETASARLARAARQQEILLAQASRLHRLVRELQWPGGPRALCAVLPAARLIRALTLTSVPAQLPEEAVIASMDRLQPSMPAHAAMSPRAVQAAASAPRAGRSLLRRLALLAYAPLRPVARPVAWRLRTFLLENLRRELEQLRPEMKRWTEVQQQRDMDGRRDLEDLRQGVAKIGMVSIQPAQSANHADSSGGVIAGQLAEFSKMLESTLLTLALAPGSRSKPQSPLPQQASLQDAGETPVVDA